MSHGCIDKPYSFSIPGECHNNPNKAPEALASKTLDSMQGEPHNRLARDAKNRDMQCIVVSDCCTAGELDVHEMTIKHVLPLLVRVRTTDEVIAALRP
jgi:Isochorismatase family